MTKSTELKSILILEEETALRTMLSVAFNGQGFIVIPVKNSVDAVKLIDHKVHIDLIISSDPLLVEFPDVPVIFTEMANKKKMVPQSNYILKPFRLNDIIEAAKRILSTKK